MGLSLGVGSATEDQDLCVEGLLAFIAHLVQFGRENFFYTLTYEIRGSRKQSDMHILLEYPFAEKLWEASGVEAQFWATTFRFVHDCIEMAMAAIDRDELGMFLAILSRCWVDIIPSSFKLRRST